MDYFPKSMDYIHIVKSQRYIFSDPQRHSDQIIFVNVIGFRFRNTQPHHSPSGLNMHYLMIAMNDADLTIQAETHHLQAGSMICLAPNTPFWYEPARKYFEHSWLRISGRKAHSLFQEYSLPWVVSDAFDDLTLVDDIFRGILREITGAADHERQFQAAIMAGMVRRGYLKGLGEARDCPYPSRPAFTQVAVNGDQVQKLVEREKAAESQSSPPPIAYSSIPVVQGEN